MDQYMLAESWVEKRKMIMGNEHDYDSIITIEPKVS